MYSKLTGSDSAVRLLAARSSARSSCQNIYAGPWTGFAVRAMFCHGCIVPVGYWSYLWLSTRGTVQHLGAGWAMFRKTDVKHKLFLQNGLLAWERFVPALIVMIEITAFAKSEVVSSAKNRGETIDGENRHCLFYPFLGGFVKDKSCPSVKYANYSVSLDFETNRNISFVEEIFWLFKNKTKQKHPPPIF